MTIDAAWNICFGKPYVVSIERHTEAKEIIKNALEELKEYRSVGTIEEFQRLKRR